MITILWYVINTLSWLTKNTDRVLAQVSVQVFNIRSWRFCWFYTTTTSTVLNILFHCKIIICDENMNEPILEIRMMGEIDEITILSKSVIFGAQIFRFFQISSLLTVFLPIVEVWINMMAPILVFYHFTCLPHHSYFQNGLIHILITNNNVAMRKNVRVGVVNLWKSLFLPY